MANGLLKVVSLYQSVLSGLLIGFWGETADSLRVYLISENNHLGSANHVLAFLVGSLPLADDNLKST